MAMKWGDTQTCQGVGVEAKVVLKGVALFRRENVSKSSLERPKEWTKDDRPLVTA